MHMEIFKNPKHSWGPYLCLVGYAAASNTWPQISRPPVTCLPSNPQTSPHIPPPPLELRPTPPPAPPPTHTALALVTPAGAVQVKGPGVSYRVSPAGTQVVLPSPVAGAAHSGGACLDGKGRRGVDGLVTRAIGVWFDATDSAGMHAARRRMCDSTKTAAV
jgi:hypothetical protein